MDKFSLVNHFLIAMPNMLDSRFDRSIIYICEHGEYGAMGIIVNKLSTVTLGELTEQFEVHIRSSELQNMPVYIGGPVQQERGFVLHSQEGQWQSSLMITDDVVMTTSNDILIALAEGMLQEKLFVSLGYSGWEAGQLEDEITQNAWLTVEATEQILFDLPVYSRYDAAMAALGINPVFLSRDIGHA